MARLSPLEVDRYQNEGWVIPQFRLPATRSMRSSPAIPACGRKKLVSAHIEGDNGEGVKGSAQFLDLARDPEIVELVSGVIGQDVILWSCSGVWTAVGAMTLWWGGMQESEIGT